MLHKKFELDSTSTPLGEDDTPREGEYRISDQEAVRCALSIPEEFVPTPHKDFIKDLEEKQDNKTKDLKQRPKMNTTSTKPSIQNGDAEFRITSKALLVRERERKLRSAFARYKKWDDASERSKVEKLEDNTVKVNDNLVLDWVDWTNYVEEKDVPLELDEDYRTCEMPPPPTPSPSSGDDACPELTCRLGCICESIKRDPPVRTHCGKPRCFFECTCQQSVFNNGDDGDIRSRLRPRVSLLNWRFMESTEKDKDPPPVSQT